MVFIVQQRSAEKIKKNCSNYSNLWFLLFIFAQEIENR